MANSKEIKNRITSIKETQKITNAMYLIASTKLRKVKEEYEETIPFYNALHKEIQYIFQTMKDVTGKYFVLHDSDEELSKSGKSGVLVVTSDKGLAGSYNQNIIKETLTLLEKNDNCELYVIGDYGRNYFLSHGIKIIEEFNFSNLIPSLDVARNIAEIFFDKIDSGYLQQVYFIYTDYGNGFSLKPNCFRLFPLRKSFFDSEEELEYEKEYESKYEFVPSAEEVLNTMFPSYVTGFIYSGLIDSYCCEQNARMMSMDAANDNAQELLERLNMEYNHARQSLITQEIIEISSGARSLNNKR